MAKATHAIDIRIAVDYSDLVNNDGVKMVLGVGVEEDFIKSYASIILEEINKKVLANRSSHMAMIEGSVSPIAEATTPYQPYQDPTEEFVEESHAEEDVVVSEAEVDEQFELLDSITKDVFKLRSYAGTHETVYLKEFDKYGEIVAKEIDVVVKPLAEFGEMLANEHSYIIAYRDVKQELNLIKK